MNLVQQFKKTSQVIWQIHLIARQIHEEEGRLANPPISRQKFNWRQNIRRSGGRFHQKPMPYQGCVGEETGKIELLNDAKPRLLRTPGGSSLPTTFWFVPYCAKWCNHQVTRKIIRKICLPRRKTPLQPYFPPKLSRGLVGQVFQGCPSVSW